MSYSQSSAKPILDGRGLEETNPRFFFPPGLGQTSAKGDLGFFLWGEWSEDDPYYTLLCLQSCFPPPSFHHSISYHLAYSLNLLYSFPLLSNIFFKKNPVFSSLTLWPHSVFRTYWSGLDKLPILLCREGFVDGWFGSTKTNFISLSQNEYEACFYVLFPSWSPLFKNINDRL